jgi:hypothetical protein
MNITILVVRLAMDRNFGWDLPAIIDEIKRLKRLMKNTIRWDPAASNAMNKIRLIALSNEIVLFNKSRLFITAIEIRLYPNDFIISFFVKE